MKTIIQAVASIAMKILVARAKKEMFKDVSKRAPTEIVDIFRKSF